MRAAPALVFASACAMHAASPPPRAIPAEGGVARFKSGMTKPALFAAGVCDRPPYLPAWHERRVEGVCLVKLKITSRGDVIVEQFVRCNPEFYPAIYWWAERCRATPAMQDGRPIAVYVLQPFKFVPNP
jgi:hypothetical protein